MNWTARRRLIGLVFGLILAAACGGRANAADCRLIFEVVPSKDAGPIIGPEVNHALATKKFKSWRNFTDQRAELIRNVLESVFKGIEGAPDFDPPDPGIGGFEGKSSPNAQIPVTITATGNALGQVITGIAAAISYVFVQDGVVASCNESLGNFGSENTLFQIVAAEGFKTPPPPAEFALWIYSAMVLANDDPSLGYTLSGEMMTMFDFSGNLSSQVEKTNEFIGTLVASEPMIAFGEVGRPHSTVVENNWVVAPKGRKLLALAQIVKPDANLGLSIAQVEYLTSLSAFANRKAE